MATKSKIPAAGDKVVYHPSRVEGVPEGTVYDAVVVSVDSNCKLNLVVDTAGGQNRNDVSFIQDDRGPVPEFAYAVWSTPGYSEKEMTAKEAVEKFGGATVMPEGGVLRRPGTKFIAEVAEKKEVAPGKKSKKK